MFRQNCGLERIDFHSPQGDDASNLTLVDTTQSAIGYDLRAIN